MKKKYFANKNCQDKDERMDVVNSRAESEKRRYHTSHQSLSPCEIWFCDNITKYRDHVLVIKLKPRVGRDAVMYDSNILGGNKICVQ